MRKIIMNTIPPCMDRYVNRYIVPPPQAQGYYHQQPTTGAPTPAQLTQQGQLSAPPPPTHPHNYMIGCYPNANGWTGVPLISTASRRPRKYSNTGLPNELNRSLSLNAADFDEHSITRLALHAQGAPLIFSGRYRCKTNNVSKKDQKLLTNNNNNSSVVNNNHIAKEYYPTPATTADTNSTTSEETTTGSSSSSISSSATNSPDTCLPRIIKPRKRRKKDRKPQANQDVVATPTAPTTTNVVSKINMCSNNNNNNEPMISKQYCMNTGETQHQFAAPKPEATVTPAPDNLLSSCSCRMCDPFCKIWAFPLRRSCSDNSAESDVSRHAISGTSSGSSSNSSINKNVGVIGGNRSAASRNEWKSTPQSLDIDYNGSRKGSFSDSGDSGCDILSGIHFSDDILSVGKDIFLTPTDNKEFQFPLNNNNSTNNQNLNNNLTNKNGNCLSETSIFNESINELSRKLSENLEIKSDSHSSDSGSVFSDSVFSDGVPDLFMNFDSISRNYLFSAGNISKLSSLLFDDNLTPSVSSSSPPTTAGTTTAVVLMNGVSCATTLNLPQTKNINNNNCQMNNMSNVNNNNNNVNVNSCNINQSLFSDQQQTAPQKPFVFVPDKDRGTEILNCFDMVWNPQKLLPVEE